MADMTDGAVTEPGSMVDPAEQTPGDSAGEGETGESPAEVPEEAGSETEIPAEAPAEAPAPLLQTGAHAAESEDDETHEDAAPPPLPASPIPTKTETPEPWFDAADDVDGGGEDEFPVRRAYSDWAIADRRRGTAHIRSERIRSVAQMFEDLAQAQEEKQAALTAARRGGRRTAAPLATTPAVPPPEREVVLVPLPPPAQSRSVDAILALGRGTGVSGGRAGDDSDAEGDEWDDEALWEKVRAKIAARRNKFRRLESQQDEVELRKSAPARHSAQRLSAERTSWLSGGKPADPAPAKRDTTAPPQQQKILATSQGTGEKEPTKPQLTGALRQQKVAPLSSQPPAQEAPPKQRVAAAPEKPAVNGHTREPARSSFGKYIEQQHEQEVLRSLGSAVLARQRLSAKEKAREQLINDRAEAERRQKKAENQRSDAQTRLQKTKGRLTRDSAFERKGLENLITRLDGTIRDETRKIAKFSTQISDVDTEIEELRRRAVA